MTEHTEPEMVVLVIHESVAASIIKDFFSLGMVIAVLFANYHWGDGNWVVNAFAVFLSLMFLLVKGSSETHEVATIEQLRKFVDLLERTKNV